MNLILRVDLDYVPWDEADAAAFGHAEPATVLRLLELARETGVKFHFFMSNRSLSAFPAVASSVLDEGHHLDWLATEGADFAEAEKLFGWQGVSILGVALAESVSPGCDGLNSLRLRGDNEATGLIEGGKQPSGLAEDQPGLAASNQSDAEQALRSSQAEVSITAPQIDEELHSGTTAPPPHPSSLRSQTLSPSGEGIETQRIQFISGPVHSILEIEEVRRFPVTLSSDKEFLAGGKTWRQWSDSVLGKLPSPGSDLTETLVLHPMVIGKADPKASILREMIGKLLAKGVKVRTLRDLLAGP